MSISFACDCGKQLKVADAHAGKRAKCPACGNPVTVPAAPPPPAETAPESDEDAALLLIGLANNRFFIWSPFVILGGACGILNGLFNVSRE